MLWADASFLRTRGGISTGRDALWELQGTLGIEDCSGFLVLLSTRPKQGITLQTFCKCRGSKKAPNGSFTIRNLCAFRLDAWLSALVDMGVPLRGLATVFHGGGQGVLRVLSVSKPLFLSKTMLCTYVREMDKMFFPSEWRGSLSSPSVLVFSSTHGGSIYTKHARLGTGGGEGETSLIVDVERRTRAQALLPPCLFPDLIFV